MKTRLSSIFTLAALALPVGQLAAQESTELGPLSAVATWEVKAADLPQFMQVAAKVAEAAKKAGLAAEYGWSMWQRQNKIAIVGQFMRAELDDPEHWMKQFQGTDGEATLMEAFQAMEGMDILNGRNEIVQAMPAWSYRPEGYMPGEPKWVHSFELWPKTGMQVQEDLNAVMGDVVAFWKEIEYPYPVSAAMVRYGEPRFVFVIPYDDPASYHGENSMPNLIAQHMAGEKWQALEQRIVSLMLRSNDSHYQFLPEQSYIMTEGM